MSGAEAAIYAGYSKKGASVQANALMKDKDIIAALERKKTISDAKAQAREKGKELDLSALSKTYSDPKEFLIAVMNDAGEEVKMRVEAAKAVMPYVHGKIGEGGKKDARQNAAAKVAKKFTPAAPPKLVVVNGAK